MDELGIRSGKVLLVHYYYPPIRSAAVTRNYYFSLEFAKSFKKVFLLTTSNRNILKQEKLPVPDNITVSNCATIDYRTILARTIGQNHIAENKKGNKVMQLFIKLQKTLPFNLFFGEGSVIYIISAYQEAKKIIRQHGITHMYSSFGPYADHIIAYIIKRRFPKIRWIADFRDLQIEPIYNNTFAKEWQRKIENRLLKRADLVSTISNGLASQLKTYGRPIVAIGRGVRLRKYNRTHQKNFTICYTGSLYQKFRDASVFFQVLSMIISELKCKDIHFLYAGKDGTKFRKWAEQFGLDAYFRDLGYLTRVEIEELQNRSHIQLLLTSSSYGMGGVLTGKLFEYIESGNPILVLIKGPRDREFEKFIHVAKAGCVVYDPPLQEGTLKDYILNHYRTWKKTGKITPTLDREYVKDNLSWEIQSRRLLTALES